MTLAPLVYASAVAGRTIVVPAEFIFDGVSVPRVPVAYWLTGGRAWGPACLHDWGYQCPHESNRRLWDLIFHEAMGVAEPSLGHEAEAPWVRALMWAGVRVVGWWPWWRHGRRRAELNPVWTLSDGWPSSQPQETP